MQRRSEYLSARSCNAQPRTGALLLSEDLFRGVLVRERRRTDRSNQPVALVLVALQTSSETGSAPNWRQIANAVAAAKRGTDVLGWVEAHKAVGLIVQQFPASNPAFSRELKDRVRRELFQRLEADSASCVSVRVHVYPAPCAAEAEGVWCEERQRRYDASKRVLDVVLSLMLLTIFWPLFVVVAALVKLTSPGPVFFRQERVGHMLKPFIMLKYRTMHVNADHAIHHQFVSSFISAAAQVGEVAGTGLFKIANDPRVTPIGRILRRTSLDELPQLWNVLRGDMSLVGPRPPLPYEVEQYKSWHKRRLQEAKPGITGLWQVTGRSRTTFDEMVRLDLRYARSYSIWTDIRILLATPRAVISGDGAC